MEQHSLGVGTNNYELIIYWSDEDKAYLAEFPDLPGAMADGATRAEALANAETIIQEWIQTTEELGRLIPSPIGRLMTIPEAAQRLGLSIDMVRRYCATNKLPAQKVGRDWTLRARDVEQFSASPRPRGRKRLNLK